MNIQPKWRDRLEGALTTFIVLFLVALISQFIARRAQTKDTPRFRPRFGNNQVANLDAKDNLVIVWLDIFNAGSESVIKDWNLVGYGPDKKAFSSLFYTTQPDPIKVTNLLDGQTVTLYRRDAIFDKTVNDAIGRNLMKGGYALFIVTNINTQYLLYPGNEFQLSFRDADDNLYTTNFSWPMPTR